MVLPSLPPHSLPLPISLSLAYPTSSPPVSITIDIILYSFHYLQIRMLATYLLKRKILEIWVIWMLIWKISLFRLFLSPSYRSLPLLFMPSSLFLSTHYLLLSLWLWVNVKGSLREWISLDPTKRTIARRFKKFLKSYGPPKAPLYQQAIQTMVSPTLSLSICFILSYFYLSSLPLNLCSVRQIKRVCWWITDTYQSKSTR